MLSLKSEQVSGEEAFHASFDSSSIQAELDFWEHLSFTFDMDPDDQSNPLGGNDKGRGSKPSRSRSVRTSSDGINAAAGPSRTAAPGGNHNPHVAQHTLPGMPPVNTAEGYEALARALRALQDAYPYLPQQPGFPSMSAPPDPSSYPPQIPQNLYAQIPWLQASLAQQQQPAPQQFPSSLPPFPFGAGNQFAQPPPPPPPHINTQLGQPSFPASTSVPNSAIGEGPAGLSSGENELGLSEEKRRRNTAASARFRVKKKQKTLNLERTVSDLSGRVDELEQEAADLRKENTWLKEIVMLKSRGANNIFKGDTQADADDADDADEEEEKEEESGGKGEGSSKKS